MNIKQMIEAFIKDGGQAVIKEQDGQRGVLFADENEFIPWGDLGYNTDLGFYQVSEFPGENDEVGVNFSAGHFIAHDGEEEYSQWGILTDDVTDGFIIGEWGDVVKLYQVLKTLVETGVAEEVDELDERLGHPWLSGPEASRFAAERLDIGITARAIQLACERGEIYLAQNDGGGWRMPLRSFRNWLQSRPRPGPKPVN